MKRVMVDIEGLRLLAHEEEMLKHPEVGGIILFSRNFESISQVNTLTAEIRETNPDILIAVDQEGGRVQRFKQGFTTIPAMQLLGDNYCKQGEAALDLAECCGWLMASEVLAVGVDFSFAPVVDVDRDTCAVIANRAFSDSPEIVCAVAEAFIKGMNRAGMSATGKHFPGHGAVEGDSHLITPYDERSLDVIFQRDITPFRYLINRKLLKGVMPAHVVYSAIDRLPAGFSPFWIRDVLRQQIGFQGMVFSDDLSMEGAAISGTYSDRACAALNAGCDMLLVCNNPVAAREVLDLLLGLPYQAPENDRLSLMKASQKIEWKELINSVAWKEAVEKIHNLSL